MTQNPSRSNVDNLNNVRRDASRHFRYKKKAYLKAKIEEPETNSKINNIRDLYRGINDFKKGNQPRNIEPSGSRSHQPLKQLRPGNAGIPWGTISTIYT